MFIKHASESLFNELESAFQEISNTHDLNKLLKIPSQTELLNKLRELPKNFSDSGDSLLNLQITVYYLFWILDTEHLKDLHEFSLRELGRVIKNFLLSFNRADTQKLILLLSSVFQKLDKFFYVLPASVIFCLEEVGNAIYRLKIPEILNFYIENLILLGFHTPQFKGFYRDYTININQYHIANLRLWFDLISKKILKNQKSLFQHLLSIYFLVVFI